MKLNSKRLYRLLLGIIVLLFAAMIGGAYGADSLLSKQATDLTAAEAKSQALDKEQLTLKKAQKDIQTYSGLLQITQAVVPEDKDQAEAVREIVNIAAANGVSLTAITFPASTLGATSGATATTTSPTSRAASAGSAKTNALSQLQPVKNIAGVYVLPITIQSNPNNPVEYDKFISFLRALEHNRRTAQASNIALQPDTKNPGVLSFTLNLNEYIKP